MRFGYADLKLGMKCAILTEKTKIFINQDKLRALVLLPLVCVIYKAKMMWESTNENYPTITNKIMCEIMDFSCTHV